MNTRCLARMLFVLACVSSAAESAPAAPVPAPGKNIPQGCNSAGISGASKDLPHGADFKDTNGQLYSFSLLECDGSQNSKKGFLLRVESLDPESGKAEPLDMLTLPWVTPDRAWYMEPTCNKPMGQDIDAKDPAVIGAVGRRIEVEPRFKYEVGNITWAWSFDVKAKKLRLLHPQKKIRCNSDGAYID